MRQSHRCLCMPHPPQHDIDAEVAPSDYSPKQLGELDQPDLRAHSQVRKIRRARRLPDRAVTRAPAVTHCHWRTRRLRMTGLQTPQSQEDALIGFTSRRWRWAVPAAGAVLIDGVLAGSLIGTRRPSRCLPRARPQLLADVSASDHTELTGTVVEAVSLGLPSLP